jgi:hypothetical protein
VDPVPDPLLLIKSASAGNWTRASGSVARNSDQYSTEAVPVILTFSHSDLIASSNKINVANWLNTFQKWDTCYVCVLCFLRATRNQNVQCHFHTCPQSVPNPILVHIHFKVILPFTPRRATNLECKAGSDTSLEWRTENRQQRSLRRTVRVFAKRQSDGTGKKQHDLPTNWTSTGSDGVGSRKQHSSRYK